MTPAIPAILLPLMELLKAPPDTVEMDEVVRLVSYDNAIFCSVPASGKLAAIRPRRATQICLSSGAEPGIAAGGVNSPDMLHGASVPGEEVGFGSGGFLEALAGMRDGLPEIQREINGFGWRAGVHGGPAARYRIPGELPRVPRGIHKGDGGSSTRADSAGRSGASHDGILSLREWSRCSRCSGNCFRTRFK